MNERDYQIAENIRYTGTPEPAPPPIPGRFEVISLLWSERFLWVYEVRDRRSARLARLWLEQISTDFEQHNKRTLALLKLNHPNLWPVYDAFEYVRANTRYRGILSAMPDPAYIPLRTLLAGSVSVQIAGQICRQLALALIYCHSQKIIHGHLQPAFIWVNPAGTIRLEMFAPLPRRPDSPLLSWNNDSSPGFLGTAYTSPEQLIKSSLPDPRIDIYSLGVIAFELLAGFNPFLGSSDFSSLVRHSYRPIPSLNKINPSVGWGLEAAIAGALVKNPDGRYPSVLDFVSRFEIGLTGDFQNQLSPPRYQTIQQLLEQSRVIAAEALNFPSQPLTGPALESLQGPAQGPTLVALPATPEPPQPAPGQTVLEVVQSPPHPAAQPVKPAPARPATGVVVRRRPKLTPGQSGFLRTFPFVPVILILNLVFMTFVSLLLLNRVNPTPPVPTPANPGPAVSKEYPTIPPAELTQLAHSATAQAGFFISPTPAALTLSAATAPPEATPAPVTSPPEINPTLAATLPPNSTGAGAETVTPPVPGPALGFSPPDNFAPGSATSANPQAAADRAFFDEARGQEALATYQADLDRNPDDAPTLRRLGRFLYLWGHPTQPDAIAILEKTVALNGNDALAWSYLAFAYFGNYDYSKGAAATSQAVTLAPDLPEALAAHALTLLYAGQPSLAVGEITRVADLTSSNPNFWVYLARYQIVRADGDLSGALTLLDNLLQGFPGVGGFYCAKAEILWMQGQANYTEAQSWLQKALTLDQNLYCIHSNLGWIYYQQGDQPQAQKEFDLALQNNPGDARALTGSGYILLNRRDYAGAQVFLEKAARLGPPNGQTLADLAAISLALGDNSKALEWATKAQQVLPDYPEAYYNAGLAAYRLNDFESAVRNLQKAVELYPSSASYQEALAFAFYGLKDSPNARQAAQASLAIQPDNPALEDLLNKLGAN
jgi:serine/threonine-protein kinase